MAAIAFYHRLSEMTAIPINWGDHTWMGHLLRSPYIIIGYAISIVSLSLWSHSLFSLLKSKGATRPFLVLPLGWCLCFVANSISRVSSRGLGAWCLKLVCSMTELSYPIDV